MVRWNKHKQSAFSLLEILIALAIASVIGVTALVVLDRSTLAHQSIKTTGERFNQIERAFLFLSGDLQQLAPRRFRDEFGDIKDNLTSFDSGGTTALSFTRLGRRNPAGLPRSNLEKLIYLVEEGWLKRISFAHPDGMNIEAGNKRDLLEGVESLKVEFYDGEEWNDFWPVEQQEIGNLNQPSPIPVAIKIILQLDDLGIVERLYPISDPMEDKSD